MKNIDNIQNNIGRLPCANAVNHPPSAMFTAARHIISCLLIMIIMIASSTGALAAENTGAIEGRVSNILSGVGLENAQVKILPDGPVTQTDQTGQFRLTRVPIGEVRLSVSFYGMQTWTRALTVAAGKPAQVEVELRRTGLGSYDADDGQVVVLEAFQVTADREMTAQAISLNEQRIAASSKSVVALDQYGNQGDDNIGEFLHFLPGVGVNVDGDVGPNEVSLRGFPSNFSNISLDGGSVATARSPSRTINLVDVPFLNASRVEVSKVPTPDMPASGLGGTINIIAKNGFELKRPAFNYRVTGITNSTNGLTKFNYPKGQTKEVSPHGMVPSVSLSFQGALTKRVAMTAALSNSWRFKPADDDSDTVDIEPTWDRVRNVQTAGTWHALPQLYVSYGGQLGFDFKITPRDIISIGGQLKINTFDIARSNMIVNYGAGATGDATHTQGADTAKGSVTIGTGAGWYQRYNKQRQINLKYAHRGDLWLIEMNADYSDAHYRVKTDANGYFYTVSSNLTSLIIRGDDIPLHGIARKYTVTNKSGNPVDIFNGENYTINTANKRFQDGFGKNTSLRLNASRKFHGSIPITIKTGFATDRTDRHRVLVTTPYNFRPNGSSAAADRKAGLFDVFDEKFLGSAPPTIYGNEFREISNKKVYELYLQNPTWFVMNETSAHQNRVTNSFEFKETISAAYLRADARLFGNRLWLTGGVRFEQTDIEGKGPLNDITAQYKRNPDGSIMYDSNDAPVLVTNDAVELSKLRYKERGASSSSDYSDFYPSLNTSYRIGDSVVLRLAYARTIGRPNVNYVIPGTTITDPDATTPKITINNPALRPWTANNYDLSIEVYDIKGGSGAISVFQKDVSNFFGVIQTPVTNALLEQQNLPTDGTYDGYVIETRNNVGDAKITGFEISYRQTFLFLPGFLKNFQVYGNMTKLNTKGDRAADFSGFIPRNISVGISYIRPRWFIKLNYIDQDVVKKTMVAESATELPGTYNYMPAYRRWTINAEYSICKQLKLFASVSDLTNRVNGNYRAAPGTPSYATYSRYQELGSYITFGVKGTF